jgi:hypothetical protein
MQYLLTCEEYDDLVRAKEKVQKDSRNSNYNLCARSAQAQRLHGCPIIGRFVEPFPNDEIKPTCFMITIETAPKFKSNHLYHRCGGCEVVDECLYPRKVFSK